MVTCSTIWCVLLAIALPTEVLSSDSSSDGHNVMKIDFLCGNDVINCESPTYPPNENSHTEAIDADRTDLGASADSETDNPAADDNTSETSVSFQRKRKFSEDEPHHPSSYEVVNGFTTSTDTNHGPMSFVGASSASSSSSAVMQTEDNADGQSANIQSESEIKERVDGILRGEFEPVPGEYFHPGYELHSNAAGVLKFFENSCRKNLLTGKRKNLERNLTKKINRVFKKIDGILYSGSERTTTLWNERGDKLKIKSYSYGYIGNDTIIAMIYQEIGKKELQSKFLLIPNVPGYNCSYYKEHFQRKYEFVYAFALPLGTDPHLTMTTFLQRFAEYKKNIRQGRGIMFRWQAQ